MKNKKINKFTSPPGPAKYIFSRLYSDENNYTLISDIDHEYRIICEEKNRITACCWYYYQLIIAVISSFLFFIYRNSTMIKNYFKITIKNLAKYKVNSFVNILGLSLGLSCSILVFLYISNEASYDKFHNNGKTLYSVVRTLHVFDDNKDRSTKYYIKDPLVEEFPEIDSGLRLCRYLNVLVKREENVYSERPLFADPEFFDFFTFDLIAGSPRTAIKNMNSAIITESTAIKYFGSKDPVGEILSVSYNDLKRDFLITGVAEDPPKNSSIRFSILLNIENMKYFYPDRYFSHSIYETYVLLNDGASVEEIEKIMPEFVKKHYADRITRQIEAGRLKPGGKFLSLTLQNIKEIHYDTNIRGIPLTNDIQYSYRLAGIALIILFVAIINYINLFLGNSTARLREIGIRKLLGAVKSQMVTQFIGESVVLTFIALVSGIIIAFALLPTFNYLVNGQLSPYDFINVYNLTSIILLTIVIGVISGCFPALFLSKFQPVDIFKNKFKFGGKNPFTKSLIIIQFSFSLFLIISTFVMGKQIKYMINRDLGFDREGVILIETHEADGHKSLEMLELYKEKISHYVAVKNVTGTRSSFDRTLGYSLPVTINGERIRFHTNKIYYDYLNIMDYKIVKGRDFSPSFSTDTLSAIINRELADRFKPEDPIGKSVSVSLWAQIDLKIVGVIENFNFESLDNNIAPALFHMNNRVPFRYILVKTSGENLNQTIGFLEKSWKGLNPDKPFNFSFMNDDIESAYFSLRRWNNILDFSSIFTLLITCIGIFCLTSLSVSRRIKEIGIRKVLGASVRQLYNLLVRDLLVLIIIANLISLPVAWYFMHNWLNDFAYKTDMGIIVFLSAVFLSITVTLLTVSYHVFKTVRTNPVDSIRYE